MENKMKLNELEQERLDYIRKNATQYGTCGGVPDNPQTRDEKRTRKLFDAGLILYVGVGERTEHGWGGGAGLIPADMFDATKHTKLTLKGPDVAIEEEFCKNSLGMPITVYKVTLDKITIAECRDPYWANFLVKAIKKEK
jgi:hypothetical protein